MMSNTLNLDLLTIISTGKPNAYHALKKAVEPAFFELLMQHNKGNQTQAAQQAGISRNTLREKLSVYGISVLTEKHVQRG
jgi:DNA-binding protein Fis